MGGFRRFIIKTAEVMMVLIVIFTTIGFAASGAQSLHMAAGGGGWWVVGLILGALVGFVFASVLAAYFFLLAEVAENTRRIP